MNNPWVISFVTSGTISVLFFSASSDVSGFGIGNFWTILKSICTIKVQIWQLGVFFLLFLAIGFFLRMINRGFKYDSVDVQQDRIVFNKIREEILPSDGSIMFIRDNNFNFSFRPDELNDLRYLIKECNKPEFYFIHPELDLQRKELTESCRKLLNVIAVKTFPTGKDRQAVPQEWEIEQPERFTKEVTTIHNLVDDVCSAYDKLIKTGRKILKIF